MLLVSRDLGSRARTRIRRNQIRAFEVGNGEENPLSVVGKPRQPLSESPLEVQIRTGGFRARIGLEPPMGVEPTTY